MSHYFTFSIIGTHIKNAENEINIMKEIEQYKNSNLNYGTIEQEIFNWNISHGILAIYSLNAALESIVALLNDKLNLNIDSHAKGAFYKRIEKLKKIQIITDDLSYKRCKEIRNYRNTITHWEENKSELLGSMSYLVFMFHNMHPSNENEKLIHVLNKEDLSNYLCSFNKLVNNIIGSKSIQNNNGLKTFFELVRKGKLSFEVVI